MGEREREERERQRQRQNDRVTERIMKNMEEKKNIFNMDRDTVA